MPKILNVFCVRCECIKSNEVGNTSTLISIFSFKKKKKLSKQRKMSHLHTFFISLRKLTRINILCWEFGNATFLIP